MQGRKSAIPALLVVIGVLALVLGAAWFVNSKGTTPNLLSGVPGGTVLAISSTSFQSNAANLNDSFFVMTMALDNGGQYGVGTLRASDYVAASDVSALFGKQVSKGFTLTVDSFSQYCAYKAVSTPVQNVRLIGISKHVSADSCNTGVVPGAIKVAFQPTDLWPVGYGTCVYSKVDTQIGELLVAQKIWDASTSLTVDGAAPKTVALTNRGTGTTSGDFGVFGDVKATGSLEGLAGLSCQDANKVKLAYTGVWPPTLIRADYFSPVDAGAEFGRCMATRLTTDEQFAYCQSQVNAINSKALNTDIAPVFPSPSGVWGFNGSSFVDSFVNVPSPTPVIYPILVYRVKAGSLGIAQPTGIPVKTFESLSSSRFTSSTTVRYTVGVKNIGSAASNIELNLACDSPASHIGVVTDILYAGQEKYYDLDITGATQATAQATCRASLKDRNVASTLSTWTISVTVDPQVECSPSGIQKCSTDNRQVLICSSGKWTTKQFCDTGWTCDSVGFTCKNTQGTSTTTTIDGYCANNPNALVCKCQQNPDAQECQVGVCVKPALPFFLLNLPDYVPYWGCLFNKWLFGNLISIVLGLTGTLLLGVGAALVLKKKAVEYAAWIALGLAFAFIISLLSWLVGAVEIAVGLGAIYVGAKR